MANGDGQHRGQRVWSVLRQSGTPILVFGAAGLALWVTFAVAKRARDDPLAWAPAQVVVGSTAFLATVLGIVVVFSRLNLQSRTQALGLPSGSIRALIALILIVVFVILATIIFGALSEGGVTKRYTGLDQAGVDGLQGKILTQNQDVCRFTIAGAPQPTPSSTTTTSPSATPAPLAPGTVDRACKSPPDGYVSFVPLYNGTYLADASNEDGKAVGQQIVTALITLMTAISAFYFADKSGERAGRGGNGPALAVVKPHTPFRLPTGDDGKPLPVEIELTGTALRDAGVTAAIKSGDDEGQVEWIGGAGHTFRYTPGSPSDEVVIAFTSKADPKVSATVEILGPLPTTAAPSPASRTPQSPTSA